MANFPTSLPSATPADHGEVVGELRAIADSLITGAAWTSYTPVLTALSVNPVLGTGSQAVGWYSRVGKVVQFYASIRFGSSGASFGTGAYQITVPVAASSNTAFVGGAHAIGGCVLVDDSTGTRYVGIIQFASSSTSNIWLATHNSGFASFNTPFTFALSDYLQVYGTYEAA